MTKFRWNHMIYDLPEGIDVEIFINKDEVDYNFVRDGQWGEHLPMLGGIGDNGETLPTWKDLGITRHSVLSEKPTK